MPFERLQAVCCFSTSSAQLSSYPGRLHTDGRWIKDCSGRVIRLIGGAVFWRFMFSSQFHSYDPLSYNDEIDEKSLDILRNAGANMIRLTVNGWIWYVKKAPRYIDAVDKVISWAKVRGIRVVLDNHAPWYDTDKSTVYKDQIALTTELAEWKDFMVKLAKRYKDESTVIGFDLLNEPRPVSEWEVRGYAAEEAWGIWKTNALDVVRAIHAVEPTYLIFVEPLGSSSVGDDFETLRNNPLPEDNIVYSVHRYMAWNYPYQDYARNYAAGNLKLARQEMKERYYEDFIDMVDAGFPVMVMEAGVYRDPARNPNWLSWMNDTLSLYDSYELSVSWFSFDPDRTTSSIISVLTSNKHSLSDVGIIWATHLALSSPRPPPLPISQFLIKTSRTDLFSAPSPWEDRQMLGALSGYRRVISSKYRVPGEQALLIPPEMKAW